MELLLKMRVRMETLMDKEQWAKMKKAQELIQMH
jgi:hypothetical protein